MIENGLPGSAVQVTGDGTHFEAFVVSEAFTGKSRLQQHRMVYATLGSNMEGAIHALSIRTATPSGAA
ncbi:MAG: BolA/IbaG family iron-sulfur metabolism protein [Gammaproteobacteria bacterium]|nr:BolA/IbaG family iron-sulfur metabolism protein [Gammaproteobacteria bacterium]